MRKWNVAALLLALGLVAPAFAQSNNDELKKQIDELRAEVSNLKAQVATTTTAGDTTLEERVNALSESLDYAGTTVNSGANPITIFGSFRTRSGWTFDRDFGQGNDDDGSYVDASFLVGFDFQVDPDVKTRFSIKSNGLYNNGDTPGSEATSNLSEVDLYEGYIEFSNIFGRKELGSREGRQEIVLGNEFQFGNNDFFSGETFDGSHIWWNSDNFVLHFLWAKLAVPADGSDFTSANHPYTTTPTGFGYDDSELYSLYFTLKSIQDFTLDVYWIYLNGQAGALGTLGNGLGNFANGDDGRDGGSNNFYYHTFGARLAGVFAVAAGLDYNLEFAYQTGNIKQAAFNNVDAFAIEGEVGLTFSEESKFRLYVRGMFAEGAEGNDSGYIPLFPERHSLAGEGNDAHGGKYGNRRARYGIMDIIPMDNVWSIQLGLTFDPAHDWTLGLTALYAEHDENVATSATTTDDGIGFEIDAFAEYRYTKHTTLGGGIGAFFPDDGAPLAGANGGNTGGAVTNVFANGNDDVAFLFFLQARVAF